MTTSTPPTDQPRTPQFSASSSASFSAFFGASGLCRVQCVSRLPLLRRETHSTSPRDCVSPVRPQTHKHTTSTATIRSTLMTNFNPGTVWLITHRTRPAWTAALHLLDDDEWHPIELVTQAMRDTADLAPRTIENHIRSATRRGWITRRGHQVRLRDRDAIETALEAADPMDGA